MPFVTTLTFQSGDRRVLEEVVEDIKAAAERKGVELKGPHPGPPTDLHVPQSKRLRPDDDQFDPWRYTSFTRTIEIVGYDEFARAVAGREFPPGIHIEVAVEQIRPSRGRG